MSILLTQLLEDVPAEVEYRVIDTRDRARNALRDAIRAECRLVMRTDSDDGNTLAQVPIEVTAGYPEEMHDISYPDELQYVLLLYRFRRYISESANGTQGLMVLHNKLRNMPDGHRWSQIDKEAITETNRWATEMLHLLDSYDPVGKALSINEDILGVYRYKNISDDDFFINKARIQLYWCVIGLVSDWLACSVEDLTVVVMTHELAHAYTQLGADIEGKRWPSKFFTEASTHLKEGLAQFYTLRTLQRTKGRFPKALEVFEILLSKQPPQYHAHVPWVLNYSAEAVRHAMLEMRRLREGEIEQFNYRVERINKELNH